jgi:Ca2+-binding EF-hand superfamily protein
VRLKLADKDKSHLIDRASLAKQLPFLTKDHLSLVIDELSQDGNEVDYSVLVYDLKGQLDEETARQIDKTFVLLDGRREGEFPIEYMLSRFQSRSLGEQFRQAVDLYARFQGIDDGTFTEDDFNDFLGFLSFDFASLGDFATAVIRPFHEEDNKSSLSHKSNRTRDFQLNKSQKALPEADVRKDKRQQ